MEQTQNNIIKATTTMMSGSIAVDKPDQQGELMINENQNANMNDTTTTTRPLEKGGNDEAAAESALKTSSSLVVISKPQQQQHQHHHQQDEWDDNGEEEEDMADAYEPQQQPQLLQNQQQTQQEDINNNNNNSMCTSPPSLNPHHSHYHPYMLPSDTCLKDARTRLHTSLEQTRIMRETFTKRLWDKYNIKMTPVEPNIETIVERCLSDEALSNIQISQNIWSWEKRIEGVVDPALVPMLNNSTGVSSALPSGAGGGSGGFSSVILPEDEEDYYHVDNNKATPNKRISGASAAAAKIILERARANAVARAYVFSDKDKAKYGNNGPIAVCFKSNEVNHLIQQKKMHSILKKRRNIVANVPRGGAVQLQPNTNVGVMGKEVLAGAGSAAVTVVHTPNLQILLIDDKEDRKTTAAVPTSVAVSARPTMTTITVPPKSSSIASSVVATVPLTLSTPTVPTTKLSSTAATVKKISTVYDSNINNINSSAVAVASSAAVVVMPKLSTTTTTSTATTLSSTVHTPSATGAAAMLTTPTASIAIPRVSSAAIPPAVGSTTKPSSSSFQHSQKRPSSSGGTTQQQQQQQQQQQYGIDLALDETLILYHKSSSSYKAKVMRHSSHGIPSLTNSWSLVTCQRLFSFEKNYYYLTARMGLRDAFIKRHLLPKMLLQQQHQQGINNDKTPSTSSYFLPPPWKWIENSSNIVLKEGTCILFNNNTNNTNIDDGSNQDIINGIGQVLNVFYSRPQYSNNDTLRKEEHESIKPIPVNNVSLAYAMKFNLTTSSSNNNNNKKQQHDNREDKATTALNIKNTKSSYDSVTVYSVLVALGIIRNTTTTTTTTITNNDYQENKKETSTSTNLDTSGGVAVSALPKFVKGQRVEALWQSPHEAHFSGTSTPYSSDVEMAATTTTMRKPSLKVANIDVLDAVRATAAFETINQTPTTTKGNWYPAVITRVVYKPHIVDGLNLLGIEGSDYRYDVAYDDGDIDEGLKVYQIRAATFSATTDVTMASIANNDKFIQTTTMTSNNNNNNNNNSTQTATSITSSSSRVVQNVGEAASKSIVMNYRRRYTSSTSFANQSGLGRVQHPHQEEKRDVTQPTGSEHTKTSHDKEIKDLQGDKTPSLEDAISCEQVHEKPSAAVVDTHLESSTTNTKLAIPTVMANNDCPVGALESSTETEVIIAPPNAKKARIDPPQARIDPPHEKEKQSSNALSADVSTGNIIGVGKQQNPAEITEKEVIIAPSNAKKARIDPPHEKEKQSSNALSADVSTGNIIGVGKQQNPVEMVGTTDYVSEQSKTFVTEKKHSTKKKESAEYSHAAVTADSSAFNTLTSSRQSSNLGLPFWRQAANETLDLEEALQWHHAAASISPSPFNNMFPPQQNQGGLPLFGYSHPSNLQGSSAAAAAAMMESRLASSLTPSQLLYATGNNDLRARSNVGGQMFPFGMPSAPSGMTNTYNQALANNNNSHGMNSWDQRTTPTAAGMYQMDHSLLGSRAAFMYGAHRGLMTLPAMQVQQAQQQAAAQMQQLLMSSATRWTPVRPHTAHALSPRITAPGNATAGTINSGGTTTQSTALLRPSSAGPLTSQSLAIAAMGPSSSSSTYPPSAATSQTTFEKNIRTNSDVEVTQRPLHPKQEDIGTKQIALHPSSKVSSAAGSISMQVRPRSAPEPKERSSPVVPLSCDSTVDISSESSGMKQNQLVDKGPLFKSTLVIGPPPDDKNLKLLTGELISNKEIGALTTLSEPRSLILNISAQKSSSNKEKVRALPQSSELVLPYTAGTTAESFLAKNYPDLARLIEQGKFPTHLGSFSRLRKPDESIYSGCNPNDLDKAAVDYLLRVGSTAPVARTWVAHEMKKKWTKFLPLSLLGIGGRSCPLSTIREVVSAVVSLWVWHNYRPVFQRAFSTKSRMDVDNECKFFHECNFIVETCVECCLLGIAKEIVAKGGVPFNPSSCSFNPAAIAGIASQVLDAGVSLSPEMDRLLMPPNLESELANLDKRRFKALQLMIYERALLTAFVARTMIMTEKYANAHLKFMLVAGETIGHKKICQLVNDDTLHDPSIICTGKVAPSPSSFNYGSIWTFLPFDVVRSDDEELGHILEDPCKPRHGGFTQGMDKDELISRAHTKALMQRCLYKLQQKYGLQGGTNTAGPYEEHEAADATAQSKSSRESLDSLFIQHIPPSVAGFGIPLIAAASGTPRGAHIAMLKRKSSFTGREIDATGGASHVGALLYPAHYCAPLIIHSHDINCMPYGKHTLVRFSASEADEDSSPLHKKPRQTGPSVVSPIVRSTEPIDWCEVAKLFQPVAVPDQGAAAGAIDLTMNIFAPDVRELNKPVWEESIEESTSDHDDESEVEDISDEAVLDRHQKVLDLMKQKLDVAMEQRQTRGRVIR